MNKDLYEQTLYRSVQESMYWGESLSNMEFGCMYCIVYSFSGTAICITMVRRADRSGVEGLVERLAV